jgi:hypothetical protein
MNQGSYAHGKRTGTWLYNHFDSTNKPAYTLYKYINDRKYDGTSYNVNGDPTAIMRFDPSRPVPGCDVPAWQETREYRERQVGGVMVPTSTLYLRNTYISEPSAEGSTNYNFTRRWQQQYTTNNELYQAQSWVNYIEPSPVMKKTGWLKEGEWINYFNGRPTSQKEYAEDVQHGVYRQWEIYDGSAYFLFVDMNFGWDRPCGSYRQLTADGRPDIIGQYDGIGRQCGIWTRYFYKGGEHGDEDVIEVTDYGPGKPAENIGGPPPPPKDPGPPSAPDKSIFGLVSNSKTGARLSGVSISAGGKTATTDANGYYSVSVGNVESVTAQFSKNGYKTSSGGVSLERVQSRVHNVKMVSTASDSAITGVESQYGQIFLGDLSVNNRFDAAADWGVSAPGEVVFVMNGATRNVAATAVGASATYDMGYDLKSAFDLRANTLEVYSKNEAGERCATPFIVNPIVVPIPKWSLKLGPFSAKHNKGLMTYKLTAEYPEEPMAIEISPEALGSVLWAAWGLVPVVGGQEFGIPPSQAGVEVELDSSGAGSVGGSGKMVFKAAGGEIEVNLGGKGLVAYDLVGNAGFEWKGAEIGGGVKGTIKRKFGPVTVIPALAGAINLPLIGRPISWFNDRAKIDASVFLGGDLQFNLVNTNDTIAFSSTEGKLSSGVELGLGGDLGKKVKARISGGGNVEMTYQLPANPSYLKQAKAEVIAKLKLSLWSYEANFENSKSLTYPSTAGARMPMAMAAIAPVGLCLLDTSFTEAEPYAVFQSRPVSRAARSSSKTLSAEVSFISNIFPYAEPVFATSGTNHAVMFVGYDPAKSVTQGNELWVSLCNAGSWSTPTPLTSDTHNDYAPTIAYTADGKLVAAWERVRASDFTSGDIEDLPPQLEIAWAVYNPLTGIWSTPTFLTVNSVMDFSPVLAASPDGALALCWLKSPDGQLIGSTAQPLSVQTAVWQGTGFGAVTTHPYAFSNAFDFAFAYDGEDIRMAFVQDSDGDLSTDADQLLYLSTCNGGSWSAPTAPFPAEGSTAGPSLLAMGPNRWELFWQQADNLLRMSNWVTPEYEIIRTNSAGFGFANLHFSRDHADRIMMTWVDLQDGSPDLYTRIFDAGVWSEDLRLTSSEGRETAITGGLCADETIRVFYTRERTNEVTDLFYTEQILHRNVSGNALGSTFAPAMPSLGEMVTVTASVLNTGNLSATNLSAAFYLGSPDEGGVLIGETTVQPSILAAGAQGTATLADWTVPEDIGLEKVYVLFDSADQMVESDEEDNLAILSPVWIDLAVANVTVGEADPSGSLIITSTIENRGNAIANNIRIQSSIDAQLLGTNTLPTLLPGLSAECMWIAYSTQFQSTQNTVRVEVDPTALLPDIDRTNNLYAITVNRTQVDGSNDGVPDDWKRQHFGHINVSAEADDDGDGQSNWEEYIAGTDPRDETSVFTVAAQTESGSGRWTISWPATLERRYQVYRTENLLDEWVPLQEEFTSWTTGRMFLFDNAEEGCNKAYYRVRLIK